MTRTVLIRERRSDLLGDEDLEASNSPVLLNVLVLPEKHDGGAVHARCGDRSTLTLQHDLCPIRTASHRSQDDQGLP